MPRKLYQIADEAMQDMWEIKNEHPRKTYTYCWPYLDAMRGLSELNQNYGADSAVSVVSYFLANASYWKGETARRIKAELNGMLKAHRSA